MSKALICDFCEAILSRRAQLGKPSRAIVEPAFTAVFDEDFGMDDAHHFCGRECLIGWTEQNVEPALEVVES